MRTKRTWMFFAPSNSRYRAKIRNMCVPKTSDHIQINIRMPNPSQEPPASSKAPNEDLKDMDLLCTFKIKIESQNLAYGCTKYQRPYPNQYQDAKPQSGTSSVLQSPKSGLKCHGCYLHLQNQDREPKFGIWSTKDQRPYPNQYQDAKTQSGTHIQIKIKSQTSVRNIQCPLKAHIMTQRIWLFLCLQN